MNPSFVFSPFCRARLGRAHRLAVVVGDRFLAEDVFPGFERGHRQLEVSLVRGADVDDVDVGPRNQRLPVVDDIRDREFGGGLAGEIAVEVADRDDVGPRITLPAGDVRHAGPTAAAEHPNTK